MKSVQWTGDVSQLEKLGMTDMHWFPCGCPGGEGTILVRALDGDYHCAQGMWIVKMGKGNYVVRKQEPAP